jgi:hypothetical protein
MDNDSGWAAKEITLTAREQNGHREHLKLPCRWVELVQAWDGSADSYFLVSDVPTDHVADHEWQFVAFKDALGKAHRYAVGATTMAGPRSIRLMRAR